MEEQASEDCMEVEFDPEFMRLYYNKIRAKEKRITLHYKEGQRGPVASSFGPKPRRRQPETNHEKKLYNHNKFKIKTVPQSLKKIHIVNSQLVEPLMGLPSLKSYGSTAEGKKTNNVKLSYKSSLLEECQPAFMRIVFRHTAIEIDIFDTNSAPVLKKQIIKMDSKQEVIRIQVIKEITMREIPGREDIRIPQILGNKDDLKFFLCPLKDCNEGFINPLVAKNHALSHLDLRPYSCHLYGCGWTFPKESHLQRHLLTHENTKNYSCDHLGCDKVFTTIYNLNEHKKKRHIQPATKLCPVTLCKETFRNDKELRTHCKQHSDEEAPLNCPFAGCRRSFFFQSTMEGHTKTHLEENQHVCTYNNCNRTFQQAYRLKEHMRSHTGAKPYKCTIGKCTKGFTTASKLKRHEISHIGKKQHYCRFKGCGKAFKRSDHLNEHIRQVHRVQTKAAKNKAAQNKAAQKEAQASCSKDEGAMEVKAAEETPQEVMAAEETLQEVMAAEETPQEIMAVEETPQEVITPEESAGPSTSINSEPAPAPALCDDEEGDLTQYLTLNLQSNMPGCSTEEECSKTEDELLEEAIKSLGVPEMKLETDLFLDVPLDLSDFSTVNLRDLQ